MALHGAIRCDTAAGRGGPPSASWLAPHPSVSYGADQIGNMCHVSHPLLAPDRPTGCHGEREKGKILIGSQSVVGSGMHLSGGSTMSGRSATNGYSILRPGECLPEGSTTMSDVQSSFRLEGGAPGASSGHHSYNKGSANFIDLCCCTLGALLVNVLSVVGSFETTKYILAHLQLDPGFVRNVLLGSLAVTALALYVSLLVYTFKRIFIGDIATMSISAEEEPPGRARGLLFAAWVVQAGERQAHRRADDARILSYALFEPFLIEPLLKGTWLLNLWLNLMGADVSMGSLILGKVSDHGLVKVCDGAVVAGVMYGYRVTAGADGEWAVEMTPCTVGERAVVHNHCTNWSTNLQRRATLTASSATLSVQSEGPAEDVEKLEKVANIEKVAEASEHTLQAQDTEGDLHKRMVSSASVEVMKVKIDNGGSFTVRYAFASQRGYYPDEPNKANQDSFVVVPEFCGDSMSLFCGVFDGHGGTGDLCSNFVAQKLPKEFEKCLKEKGSFASMSEDSIKDASKRAHVSTNEQLHATSFDDTLSGTTAISLLLKGDTMFVANVGDSRAIICARQPGEKSTVRPLSVDQTPFRKDERTRIKEAGGHVLTIDQIEGLEPIHENWDTQLGDELDEIGDPPRVWLTSLDQPGCAFTRSLGDSIGESVGVFAEPEQLVLNVSKHDKFVVIASDGVFEFITSHKVMEAVERFTDPLSAAKHIVQEAFRTWLRYEVRTDDITIIVLFIEDFDEGSNAEGGGASPKVRRQTASFMGESVRPVRRYFSKEAKSRLIREGRALDKDDEETFDVAANEVPKTQEEVDTILAIVKDIFLFQHLSKKQMADVVRVISREQVQKGDTVIKQGDKGDKFYIVDAGEFEVSVTDHNGVDSVISHISLPGVSFGELSLMYGKPRTATVTCVHDGWLWCLERKAFRGILVDRMTHDNTVKILRKVKTLKPLSTLKLQQLISLMEEESFKNEEYIATEGELGEKFFIVVLGNVKCYIGVGHEREEVARIKVGGYFGETALLHGVPTKGSFVSSGNTRVLSLRRSTMEAKLGPLQSVIDQAGVRMARGEAMKEKNESLVASLQGTTPEDIRFKAWAVQLGSSTFVGQYEHVKASKTFAVKASLKRGLVEEGHEVTLIAESRILSNFSKPNLFVPTQLLTLQDTKCIYCVYKQSVVCDLACLLEQGPLPEATVCFFSACVKSAVVFLHEEGFIHRNVTPHCVYLTDAGYCQLADLTCAKKMDGNKAYTMVGDPHYMAPEQISGQGYEYGVDYWSLGILMFAMLHVETPFAQHTSETQVYTRIASFKPENLPFKDGVSPLAQGIVRACLEAPMSGEDVAGMIGDRSDPQFETEFLHGGEDNDNERAAGDDSIDALFKAF
eukprot:g16856.t2